MPKRKRIRYEDFDGKMKTLTVEEQKEYDRVFELCHNEAVALAYAVGGGC